MKRYLDWLDQGKRDLEKAKLDLKYKYYEWACFTSQQAAEKVVKSLGMKLGLDMWGHSLLEMLKILEKEKLLEIHEKIFELAKMLDKYYIPTRYPNSFPSGKPSDYYTEKEAEEAINAASNIIRFCEGYIYK